MKRSLSFVTLLLAISIILPITVKAESIINNNGIVITEEEYNNFIQIHSHAYIMTMDELEYEKLSNLNYNNLTRVVKYYSTTYNPRLNITTERELTKEEYDNFSIPRLNSSVSYYETTAKELVMTFMPGSYYNFVTLTATWKYIPTTRVFDVIGFRGDGFSFRNGSQTGTQMYIDASGTYHSIHYSWNGTNIKKFSDGFGISMNLVNPTIQALSLDATCDVVQDVTHPVIFGAYEHAINSSVTLADSQNYTMGGSGLGGVFVYPYSISAKYDGMSGVEIEF